jgi:hypothetical protein
MWTRLKAKEAAEEATVAKKEARARTKAKVEA